MTDRAQWAGLCVKTQQNKVEVQCYLKDNCSSNVACISDDRGNSGCHLQRQG